MSSSPARLERNEKPFQLAGIRGTAVSNIDKGSQFAFLKSKQRANRLLTKIRKERLS